MSIKSMRTSITLTNNDDKKYLTFKSFSNDESKKSNMVEINNALDSSIVQNFLNTSLKSIRYVKTFIENNKYRECMEIKNSGDSSLIIISDDVNKYFKEILDFIDENRTKIYEKYLFDLICKHEIDELIFGLSSNEINSEIKLDKIDGKTKLFYYLPYTKDKRNKKIINQKDLDLIQNTINNYFGISNCELISTYDDAVLGYLIRFVMYTNKADIIINGEEIYTALELYIGMIKKDLEMKWLEEREENFRESQKNIMKNKLKVLKKEEEQE